jgi:ferrous iron transport protein A
MCLKKGETSMDLSLVEKNKKVKVIDINAPTALKKRLASLGVSVGKEVEVLETTIQKNTIKIGIGLGSVALRLDEAKCVNVEAIHA